MSGLFRRLSSRRSDGPEGAEPPAQADQGAADAPATTPAEPGGHQSLLVDPAAQTRVLGDDDQPTTFQRPGEAQASAGEPAVATGDPAATSGEGAPAEPADPARTIHPVMRLPSPAGEPQSPYGPGGAMLPASDLPAGVDPDELAAAPPTSARRSRLRKRVSFLRAAREVLMRDLGGFVYELHRTARDIEHEAHRRLRDVKLARLTRLDAELHELELRLDDVRRHVIVREPGVGGECPHCGELFGSDAHYCAHCGLPLTESARRAVAHEAAPPEAAAEPQPAAPRDQPTEEYSPLRAGDPEFAWPPRAAGESGAAAPIADEAPTGVIGAGAPASDAAAAAEQGAPATGEAPVAGEAEPAAPATGAAPQADRGEAATAAGDDTPAGPDSEAATAAGDDAPATPDAEAGTADKGDAPATPDADAGTADKGDAPAEAAAATPGDDEPASPDAEGGSGADGETAGRNGTALSPAERRR